MKATFGHFPVAQEALIQLNKLKCSESAHGLQFLHETNYSNNDALIRYRIIKAHIWNGFTMSC